MFEVRRLAELYDPLDPDRSDLDVYLELAKPGARQVRWVHGDAGRS